MPVRHVLAVALIVRRLDGRLDASRLHEVEFAPNVPLPADLLRWDERGARQHVAQLRRESGIAAEEERDFAQHAHVNVLEHLAPQRPWHLSEQRLVVFALRLVGLKRRGRGEGTGEGVVTV